MWHRRVFKSLASDQRAYAYDSEYFNYRNGTVMSDHFRTFETYGHGLTAHSPDCPIPPEYFADYLRSLAVAMNADHEIAKSVSFDFAGPSKADLEFAASVKYKAPKDDGKYRRFPAGFYSLGERKVSKSEALEHDKRYEEIRDWMDGSYEAVCRLLWKDWHTFFKTYVFQNAIRDWFWDNQDGYPELPPIPGSGQDANARPNERHDRRDAHGAFKVCLAIIEGVRLLDQVQYSLNHWQEKEEACPCDSGHPERCPDVGTEQAEVSE